MKKERKKELVVVATAGNVDDGKSTLVGRLLFDCNDIYEDQLDSLKDSNGGEMKKENLALLTDGLSSEREQGITIDVAYRHFSRPGRKFIIADVPGHEQYVRNMATGASKADLLIIIIDASKGISCQSKRHLFISSLLGIGHIVVVINKMDMVGYDMGVYEKIKGSFLDYARKIGIPDLQFIPISALEGDMVVKRGDNLDWYGGSTLLNYLENVELSSERNLIDFRLPVQYVIRADQRFRGYAGRIEGGVVRKGEEVVVLPSGKKSKIKSIFLGDKKTDYAFESQSVVLEFEDEIDVGRGDMIAKCDNFPKIGNKIEFMVIWFSEKPLAENRSYLMKHTTKTVRCRFSRPKYVIDPNNLHRIRKKAIGLNDIGRVTVETTDSLLFDEYEKNKSMGSFIIIDELTNETLGAGMIVDKGNVENPLKKKNEFVSEIGCVVWLTGLSGAGKTTIADKLHRELRRRGVKAERLDGDEVRKNLTKDLGFSAKDRNENIRRVAFVCELLSRNGIVVIASFVSPYRKQRSYLRKNLKNFVEVYVNTPLEVCEKRDIKGIYKKARSGEIKNFTGISDVYEDPLAPEITVCGDKKGNAKLSVEEIISYMEKRGCF